MATSTLAASTAGTAARAVTGVTLLVSGVTWQNAGWWDLAGALVVLPAFALAASVAVDAILSEPRLKRRGRAPWSGVQMAAAGVVIVAVVFFGTGLTFVSPLNGGVLFLFFGGSMLLASALGYDGCEILALPHAVLGRREAIWCPLYSPLDDADDRSEHR